MYGDLDEPSWVPPPAVIAPVWSALYVSMGVAAWRLWRAGSARTPLALHGTQLALNAAWPAAFFARRSRPTSLTIIVALDVVIAAEIATARRHDRAASALLAPYLAWTLFATALNAAVRHTD